MIIQIKDEESIEEFKKNLDCKELTIQIPIPYKKNMLDRETIQYTIMYKTFGGDGIKFGDYNFHCDFEFSYGSYSYNRRNNSHPSKIWFRYSNAKFYVELPNLECTNLPEILVSMTAQHLRKNKERAVKIVLIDKIYYLELVWSNLYSEVIRINHRVKTENKRREIKKMGRELKLLALRGKLIQDGLDNFYTDCDEFRSISSKIQIDGCELSISLLEKDNFKDLEVTDDTNVVFDNGKIDRECTYGYAIKYTKLYMDYINKLNQIGQIDE